MGRRAGARNDRTDCAQLFPGVFFQQRVGKHEMVHVSRCRGSHRMQVRKTLCGMSCCVCFLMFLRLRRS